MIAIAAIAQLAAQISTSMSIGQLRCDQDAPVAMTRTRGLRVEPTVVGLRT